MVWKGIFGILDLNKIRCVIQEKHKISWRETGFDCYPGSGIHQNLGRGMWDFFPSLSGTENHDDSLRVLAQMRFNKASVQLCLLSTEQNIYNDLVNYSETCIKRSPY